MLTQAHWVKLLTMGGLTPSWPLPHDQGYEELPCVVSVQGNLFTGTQEHDDPLVSPLPHNRRTMIAPRSRCFAFPAVARGAGPKGA